MMKHCSSCNTKKEEEEFYKDSSKEDGLRVRCKDCDKKYAKDFYSKNANSSRAKMRKYAQKNKEERQKYFSSWKEKNLEHYKELLKRNKEKEVSKLAARLSNNLKIKWKDLGISSKDFIFKIQSQFTEGMDWSGYKKEWDIERCPDGTFKIKLAALIGNFGQ